MKHENSCLNNSLGTLRNAKATSAVNKEADAPIFKAARYGTAGDLLQILPRPSWLSHCVVGRWFLSCVSWRNLH